MCGIVGAISFKNSHFPITREYLFPMREALNHRGPDAAGFWFSAGHRVGLGHRRLSIIDLSDAATQPMCNESQDVWVCFNGEIYNHAEIRPALANLGHKFKTDHSDTEVIIHAFEQWGIKCLDKFRGMFAIAIWDGRKKELWLIRDRMGIKPLYYSIHHGRITFASEIKALLKDPEQKREVNEEGLYHYLSFLTTPVPQTLFSGIKKLPPATWLKITEDGDIEQKKYWDVLDSVTPLSHVPEQEISRRLLDELRRAVQLRKVGDVPIGIFLSGGIDSSTNTALFSEGETRPVKTFSIGYQGNYKTYQNEFYYARIMADHVKAQYYECLLTLDDLIGFLPRMVYLQDEPIADPVCVPVYYVSKLARDNGVIVCQVGEGADELFGGYPYWQKILGLQKYNALLVPNFLKKTGCQALSFLGKNNNFAYEFLRRASNNESIFWGGAEAFTESQKKNLLSPRLSKKFQKFSSWEIIREVQQNFNKKAWDASYLQWMSYLDLNIRLPELLLMRVDKMSMGVSVECRVPFLDHKFVELAMSIPASVKMRHGTPKYILKKTVKGLIPDELIYRKKQGFGVPIYEWLFDRLGSKINEELKQFCEQTDLLDKRAVESLRRKPCRELWYLFNLALWWKTFIK